MIRAHGTATTLKIDLSNIAGTPGARGSYPVSEQLAPTEDCSCIGPVTGEITVENTGSLLLVKGQFQALLELCCVRCLGPFQRSITIDIQEEFATEDTAPDIRTIDRDEPEVAAMSDYVLDVSELARQQLVTHVPMASRCRPDCRGICPQCGHNLNQSPCGCSAQPIDDRWAKLRDLMEATPQQQEER